MLDRAVLAATVHRLQDQLLIVLTGLEPYVRLYDNVRRRMKKQWLVLGRADDLQRLVKVSTTQRVGEPARHGVKVNVDGGHQATFELRRDRCGRLSRRCISNRKSAHSVYRDVDMKFCEIYGGS